MATTVDTPARLLPASALLARLGREATTRVRNALRPLELSAQEFIVLKQLETMGTTSQSALADAVVIDYSNLATLAAGLCGRDLLVRARDEADRRRYVLELSPAGRRLVERADAAIAAGEAELLAALDGDERDDLYALLRRVADSAEICPTVAASACQ